MRILNLGCGHQHIEGAINVDISPDARPDLIADLSTARWPFADNSFREVHANDIIEHLPDTVSAMEELHRICASGARVHITVPHFSSANAFLDPTHRRYFSARTMDLFTSEPDKTFFTSARFRVIKKQIVFQASRLNRFVAYFANRNQERYEERYAWVFPAWFIIFELEVVKST
jgi:predicted SAM-dependent methyltransferase